MTTEGIKPNRTKRPTVAIWFAVESAWPISTFVTLEDCASFISSSTEYISLD